jgi:hypothetical protein
MTTMRRQRRRINAFPLPVFRRKNDKKGGGGGSGCRSDSALPPVGLRRSPSISSSSCLSMSSRSSNKFASRGRYTLPAREARRAKPWISLFLSNLLLSLLMDCLSIELIVFLAGEKLCYFELIITYYYHFWCLM